MGCYNMQQLAIRFLPSMKVVFCSIEMELS